MIVLVLIVLAAFALFYFILQADIPWLAKFLLVCLEMILISQYFIKRYKLSSELGLVLLKSNKGIELINRLAVHEKAFNFMADLGCAVSYGLLSLVLMRKRISAPVLALGIVILGLLSLVVAPFALSFLFQVINVGPVNGGTVNSLTSKVQLGAIAEVVILLCGGFFLFVLSGVILYGAIVVNAVIGTMLFGANTLAKTSAGGTFLLPGINLPLFEGILALVVVLIVHEGAHAVLTRIARVPLKSSGLVLFGVIPIGAFVEPDEKRLARADPAKQTRVLVAGPTANLLTSLAFFVLFTVFFIASADFRDQGYLVISGMASGAIIHSIDGKPVDMVNYTMMLPKNAELTLDTNYGQITKATNSDGKLGITFEPVTKNSATAKFTVPGLEFIYTTLGLIFALNFVVGVVNLMPIPLFDGYRVIDVNVKNKMIVQVVSYTALLFFVLNFLPLIFH